MSAGRRKPLAIDHHPSAQLLSDHLIANVSPGVAFAVAAHLELCPACRLTVAAAEGSPPGADRTRHAPPSPEPLPLQQAWPAALRHACGEHWSPMRKGVEGMLAPHVSGLGECVYLLRAAPGADVGAASVRSAFILLVTAGGLELDGRRLGAGDLVQLQAAPAFLVADGAAGASVLVVADESPRRLRRPAAG